MNAYTTLLQGHLSSHADPEKAGPMAAYMRDQFPYLGIQTPERSALLKEFYNTHGLPPVAELEAITRELWALPEREFQYAGIGLVGRCEGQLRAEFIETIEYLIVTKSWWDTVDSLAGGVTGTHFKRFPEVRRETISRWRVSGNFWLRRSTLLFQLGYKQDTDFPLLCDLIRENLGSKEFFINKAIGWALREYSKTDAQAVRDFVQTTPLQPLSAREALKWLSKPPKVI